MNYQKVLAAVEEIDKDTFEGDEIERTKALDTARRLCDRLERPWETLFRMGWLELPLLAALRIAVDTKAFDFLKEGPLTTAELAEATKTSPELLRRVMRLLAAKSIISEEGGDEWAIANMSDAFANNGSLRAGIHWMYDVLVPAMEKFADYFAQNDYQLPAEGKEVWKFVTAGNENIYEWMSNRPDKAANFEAMMADYSSLRRHWSTYYSIDNLLQNQNPDAPFLVDISGGMGTDLEIFRERYGDKVQGDLILQDSPNTIAQAKAKGLHPSITPMVHDVFEPQPVHNARIYYLHSVMFNWSDKQAQQILANLKPALAKGYSRVLIHESVLTSRKTQPICASMDIFMLGVMNSKVRTQFDWMALISRAGLSLIRVWSVRGVEESILEVALP